MAPEIRFDSPDIRDAANIRRLIERCKPLDVNSTYAYLLLCHHFADTSVVARRDSKIIGFVSAYIPPRSPTTVFVWQVAVHPDARGSGLGRRLLEHLLKREALERTEILETTISPTNRASRAMFIGLAKAIGVGYGEHMLFDEELFGCEAHEPEVLLKLGPMNQSNRARDRAS